MADRPHPVLALPSFPAVPAPPVQRPTAHLRDETWAWLVDAIAPEPNTGCWLWLKTINPEGYAQVKRDGRLRYVHRLVYEEAVAPIPPRHVIDHTCRLTSCVIRGTSKR
jgi:hypothetical protein